MQWLSSQLLIRVTWRSSKNSNAQTIYQAIIAVLVEKDPGTNIFKAPRKFKCTEQVEIYLCKGECNAPRGPR
jgi:hypothetical protein